MVMAWFSSALGRGSIWSLKDGEETGVLTQNFEASESIRESPQPWLTLLPFTQLAWASLHPFSAVSY